MARTFGEYTDIAGRFGNLNAGDPDEWDYVADQSITSRMSNSRKIGADAVTAQLSQRNKVSASYDYQMSAPAARTPGRRSVPRARRRLGGGVWLRHVVAGVHDESGRHRAHHAVLYTAPVTNKLLLEAAASQFLSNWNPTTPSGALDQDPFIPVQEQSIAGGVPVPNMVYHGYAGLNNNHQTHNVWRASLTYVTGAHSMKGGYQAAYEVTDIFGDFASHGLQYRFLAGVPNQITQRITPWRQANRTRWDAFYLQDQWTRNRLTLQGALRYEKAWSFFPEGLNGLQGDSLFGGPKRTLAERRGRLELPGHRAAHGAGLRRVRQRQDGHQGEPVEVLAVCRQRRGVYRDQPGGHLCADGHPGVERRERQFLPDCDLEPSRAGHRGGGDSCGGLDNQIFFGFRHTGS